MEAAILRCELLNGFRLLNPDGETIRIPVTKGAAMIAYLLLSDSTSVSRGVLAGLLWSERPEAVARTALRQCLHQLRSHLSANGLQFLSITQDDVCLDRSRIRTDIDDVIEARNFRESALASLLEDKLLYAFEDLDPAFMEWIWEIRRATRVSVCAALMQRLEDTRAPDLRFEIARGLNRLDPCSEQAARVVIEQHARSGNLVELLRVYKGLWDALAEEWDEEPSSELQALVGETRTRLSRSRPHSSGSALAASDRASRMGYVSVLCLKLRRSVDTAPDAFAGQRARFIETARPELEARADRLIDRPECDLCALFGWPLSHENNARDALDAALSLRDALAMRRSGGTDASTGPLLTVAIDTGLMAADAQQVPTRDTVVSGPALDRAADLVQSAGDPAIYATDRTVRRLRHLFVTLKEPVPRIDAGLVRVIGRTDAGLVPDTGASDQVAFVGRTPFLAALHAAWSEAKRNTLQIVSLQGQAGVGKSRLVEELFRDIAADGARTAGVVCNRHDRHGPLDPLLALRRLLAPDRIGTERDPRTLVAELGDLIGSEPTAVFLDDWHWSDDATRLVLQDTVAILQDRPVMLIIASRDLSLDDGLVRASHQLHLPPMNALEIARKSEQLLRRPIGSSLRATLYAKSGGNPLYLEEICHAIGRAPQSQPMERVSGMLSANLHALIASRIGTLDDDDARIVFAAAPHTDVLNIELLEEVLGEPLADTALERLRRLDVIAPGLMDRTVRFKHGITRDVIYNMIDPDRRRALHTAYFKALSRRVHDAETSDEIEQLALHARESGDIETAAKYSEIAGDNALRASSLDLAQRQFATAMTLLDQMPASAVRKRRWLSISTRWAQPCVYAASQDHIPVLQRAADIARELGDAAALAEVLYWTGYVQLVLGQYDAAIELFSDAHTHARTVDDPRLLAETTAIHGSALAAKGRYAAAEEKLRVAIDAKERHPVQPGKAPVTSAYSRAILALLRGEEGRFDEAETLLEEALARVEGFRHEIESSILNLGSAVHLWRGNFDAARAFARRSRQRAERVSAPYLIGMSRCLLAYADWRMTGDDSNIAVLQTTTHWLDAQGMRLYISFPFSWLADALADMGRFDDAATAAQQALVAAETGEAAGAALSCRVLARVELADGGRGLAAARTHLAAGRQWADRLGARHEKAACDLTEAEMLLARGQTEAARVLQSAALRTFRDLGMPWHVDRAIGLVERLGEPTQPADP